MIGIIGQGFVGNAVYQKFKKFYSINTFDLDASLCNSTYEKTIENDIIFLCLPTPMNRDGSCNTRLIENEIRKIDSIEKILIVKSTVIPGTVQKWNSEYKSSIVFNPEFLTERNAVNDYENQNRIVLGGPDQAISRIKMIFNNVFPKAKIIKTDSTTAEMVKYMTNAFLSVKVSFANEMYKLSKSLDIDYDRLVEYAIYDDRLGGSHWNVPGPDGDFGFGGHCFPKDLSALIHLTDKKNSISNVLKAALETNDQVRKNRDWEKMKGRAVT
jgi:nucleotide sugar dehydrogenase